MGYDDAREAALKAVGGLTSAGGWWPGDSGYDEFVANAALDAFLGHLSADLEMVERVGRALAAADAKNGRDPRVHYDAYPDMWNRFARAAIAAMLAQEVKG